MVWWNNPEWTCNIKMYDPPYVLLHHSQLQIIHSVKKWAALNWHVCKSAATGRESQKENSLASDIWLQSFKETNTQPFRGAGRGFISMTETAAIHLIMCMFVCSPRTEIRKKKKKWKKDAAISTIFGGTPSNRNMFFPPWKVPWIRPIKLRMAVTFHNIPTHCEWQIRWTGSCARLHISTCPRQKDIVSKQHSGYGQDVTNSVRVNMV